MADRTYVNGVSLTDAGDFQDFNDYVYTPTYNAKRAAVYQYTAWDPSDVASTPTDAPATAAASSTATDFVTMANSSGTLTLTYVTAGIHKISVEMQNEAQATSTLLRFLIGVIGGTATRYFSPTIAHLLAQVGYTNSLGNVSGSFVMMVSATVGQTVTLLPQIAVTSGGATTNFTTQCTVISEYMGTN